MTKKQQKEIARLGAEWTVLDFEEQLIYRSIFEQHFWPKSATRPPRNLKELEGHQRFIFRRKREISAKVVAIESGKATSAGRSRGKSPNPYVLVRDLFIRSMKDRSDEDICKTLDLELAASTGRNSLGIPESWARDHKIRSYMAAYQDPDCKGLVQKLISVAKNRLISYPL